MLSPILGFRVIFRGFGSSDSEKFFVPTWFGKPFDIIWIFDTTTKFSESMKQIGRLVQKLHEALFFFSGFIGFVVKCIGLAYPPVSHKGSVGPNILNFGSKNIFRKKIVFYAIFDRNTVLKEFGWNRYYLGVLRGKHTGIRYKNFAILKPAANMFLNVIL